MDKIISNPVWKMDFRVRLKKAIQDFKKRNPEPQNTLQYKKQLDDLESRWKPKAQSKTEQRVLERELNKLKFEKYD